jgi:S-adenosylmethionine decarboxylase proenzyme
MLAALASALLFVVALEPAPLERLGTHVILEVHRSPFDVLNSSSTVQQAMRAAVSAGSLTAISENFHSFPVMGVSGLMLLSESHLSVHTWPQRGYAAVDLFSCGPPSPLPCAPNSPVTFAGADTGWRCDSGAAAPGAGPLWRAVEALLTELQADGARLTWIERGPPAAAAKAKAGGGGGFGWLGGLERDHEENVEL